MKEQRWVVGFLLVLAVALAVAAGVFQMRANQFRAEAEALRAEGVEQRVIEADEAHAAEVANLKKQMAELQDQLELANAPAGEAVAAATAPVAKPEEKKKDGTKSMMKSMAEMMTDPAMKDMVRQQQRVALKGMYSDLFAELGLSAEVEDAMMELLVDKQMVNTELGMSLIGGNLSDEEKERIGEEIVASTSAIDGEIEALLGEESFASYELFVDSQQERMQLNTFKESLRSSDEPLSFEAEEQLMNAMYETRKNFKFTTDFGTDSNPNPKALAGFDQDSADRMIAEMRRLNEEIVGKAAGILTPGQLEAFQTAQESQVKMQEMGIKMGLQMMQE